MPSLITLAQTAFMNALNNSGAVQATLGTPPRVYTQRPATPCYPYLQITALECRDSSAKWQPLQQLTFTLQLYGRSADVPVMIEAMVAVKAALHDQELPLSTGSVVRLQEDYSSVFFDATSQTQIATLRYKMLVAA